ncbi:transcription factor RF2a-like [Phoenix dactylifera]|uniref:Transcription factor RF2a-like n=1 Tax=Phoenix dactylifera TaxID=42345 RepID=A0A8B7BYV0_PHODC|nr:transcription factor RF2a-like [Phoenix dactylifera]
MDKDNSPIHGGGGGLPPHSSRFSASFAAFSSKFPAPGDPSPSSSSQPNQESCHDISRMPDLPPRNPGHRRAYSEILGLPDDIGFYSDLGIVGLHDDADEDLFSAYFDAGKFNSPFASSSGLSGGEPSGLAAAPPAPSQTEKLASAASNERPGARHQNSQSMDGSPSVLLGSSGEGPGPTPAEMKKAMTDARLDDLALVDSKRAKRIWANRQSAARSKERKMRYIVELEQKVQNLQTDATTLSTQLTMLQRDTNGLTVENSELKLQLQTMEQQVHLQDALNDALQEEVQRLKLATGQLMPNGGPMMNFGPPSFGASQQFYHHNQAMQSLLAAHQFQQLHIHSQHQRQLHPLQPLQQQQQLLHPHHHQQLMHPHQQQQRQQQPPVDLRMKGPMTYQNKGGEGSSDDNSNQKE